MEKKKRNVDMSKSIAELTDAEFLSFLYSERDRENSLSLHQGWNNWALVGAFVAALWTAYTVWKDYRYIEEYDVVYYTSGIMAVFLTFYSWLNFLKRERGIDFSKVRWLKEVFPYHLVLIALGCSISFCILIAIEDGFTYLFWLWCALFVLFALTIVSVICYRDRLTPAFADGFMFPWIKVSLWYYAVLGSLYGPIALCSFKMTSSGILSGEFEIASCISASIVLLYFFFKINRDDKAAERFDVILDEYVYMNVSRDKTYQEIQKNRMGYGVMGVCYKDLAEISDLMIECEENYKRLDKIKNAVEEGECIIEQFNELQKESAVFFDHHIKVIRKSRRLSDKLSDILTVSAGINNIAAIHVILDENEKTIDRIALMKDKVQEVVTTVQKRVDYLKENPHCDEIPNGGSCNNSCTIKNDIGFVSA